MAKAKKLPSGNWRVRVYVGTDENGKMIYKSFTASTKKEAEFLAAEYNLTRKEKPKGVTVGDAIDGYISTKEHVLSASTITAYKAIRRSQMQGIMQTPLDKIDNITIQAEINKEAKRLSPKSVRNAHGLLSAALAMYMPDFTLRTTLPAKEHKIKDLPTPEEIMRAFHGTEIELPVLLAMYIPARLGEIQGIRYCDIDGDGVLTLQHERTEVGGHFVASDTLKTYNSTRRVRLNPALLGLVPPPETDDPEEYLFKYPVRGIYKRFRRIAQDAGLKEMSFHDLRHVGASWYHAIGVKDAYLQERGGWSTGNVLKSVYTHTFTDERAKADDKIDAAFDAIYKNMTRDMTRQPKNIAK